MLPSDLSDDRRAAPGRRRGVHRRVGERRLEVMPVTLEARTGVERRHDVERRTGIGRRREEGSRPGDRRPVVLFVGEDPADARLLEGLLQKSTGEPFELVTTARRAAALERVAQGNVDVVLVDLSLPGGLESFAALNPGKPVAPFLVLSRVGDEQRALNAVRAGAQDCLVKGRFDGSLLSQTLRFAIERHRMRSALGDLALTDELTGLHNRRGFVTLATQDLALARRGKKHLLVAFGDLDDLKGINDTLGHAEGDAALRDVAGVLRRTFRESDLIARIGGDEFAVLVRSAADSNVDVLRRRLSDQLTDFNRRAKRRYRLSISLGFAHRAAAAVSSVESLLRRADKALYQEKRRRESDPGKGHGPWARTYEARPIEILLVEDEPRDIKLTQQALARAKLQNRLSVVRDGADALSFLRGEDPYEGKAQPDVVLLNLNLPRGDGRDVLRAMRHDPELRDIPVVILTGTNAEHAEFESLRPDAFLTKPIDFDRLAQAVGTVANLGFTIVKLPA
jgi:two-component system cell cycle response regulator